MEQVFISNGETQLILIPANEKDKVLLADLLNQGPLEIQSVSQPIGVLGKSVQDAIIIRKKQVGNGAS